MKLTNKIRENKIELCIYGVFLLMAAIFIYYNASLSPLFKYSSTDSSVFLTVANEMIKGKLMYLDIFDHKGPILYLINYLGVVIGNGSRGVFLIEILFMFVNMSFAYKTMKIIFNRRTISFLIALLVPVLFYSFFDGGNLTEEYIATFIFIFNYVVIKSFKNKNMSNRNSIFLGMLGISILLIKPNFIIPLIPFSFIYLYHAYSRDWRNILKKLFFILIGAIIILVPFSFYFIVTGTFDDFIYQVFLFNFEYVNVESVSLGESMEITYNMFLENCSLLIFLIISGWALLIRNIYMKKEMLMSIGLFLVVPFLMYSIGMSGHSYKHYMMVSIPYILIMISVVASQIILLLRWKKRKYLYGIIYVVVFIMIFNFSISKYLKHNIYIYRPNSVFEKEVIEYMNMNYAPSDKLLVIGNNAYIYTKTDFKIDTKYIYQVPLIKKSKEINIDFHKYFLNSTNDLVLINRRNYDKYQGYYHIENVFNEKYEKVFENDNYILYSKK